MKAFLKKNDGMSQVVKLVAILLVAWFGSRALPGSELLSAAGRLCCPV